MIRPDDTIHKGIEKLSAAKYLLPALGATTVGAATLAGVYYGLPRSGRKQVGRELRDPRLYSNMKNVLKSRKKAIAAHRLLKKKQKSERYEEENTRNRQTKKKEEPDPYSEPVYYF